jgi:membrane dipeptidase
MEMVRKVILALCGALIGGGPIWLATQLVKSATEDGELARVHGRVLTLDSHVDIPPTYTRTPDVDPGLRTRLQVDLPSMEEGGLDAAFFIVYVGQTARTVENYARATVDALVKFDAIHAMTDTLYPDLIGLAATPDDVRRLYAEGRKAAVVGIENGYVIGKDMSLIADFYERGARYMTLAHVGHNDIADSSMPRLDLGDGPSEHGGLSAFGREVVREMNRVGMMVDISHISRDAMMQALDLSVAPVIASHSATIELADHPRNLDEEQMREIAAKGGVAQMVAFSAYVKVDPARAMAGMQLRNRIAESQGADRFSYLAHGKLPEFAAGMAEINRLYPRATLAEFVDHIDHAVAVMGIDHVGISSDFDGGGGVIGWNNAAETENVTRELLARGYSEEEIAKLWSGNLLRVWAEVDAVAERLQSVAN